MTQIVNSTSEISPENNLTEAQEQPRLLINEILKELQLTPKEQWENLLQIMRTFRQATNPDPKPAPLTPEEQERREQIKKNQAVIELLRKWEEEGDEQEQTETFNYLQEVLK